MDHVEFNAALEELGWSQTDLARRLEAAAGEPVSVSTIWRYANDRRKVPPPLAAYLKLCLSLKAQGNALGQLLD